MSNITKPIFLNDTAIEMVDALTEIKDAILGVEDNPIYGVKRSLTSAVTAWTRTDSAVGLVANATHDGSAVVNDFDNIYPWSDIKTVNYSVEDDEIVSYIGDADFTFDGSNGEVMTLIPGFYIKRFVENGYEHIQIARHHFSGSIKVNNQLIARYTTSSGTHSKSGVASTVSQNIATFRTQARAKGNGWHQLDILTYCILQDLYLVEYADGDSQAKLGQGVCSASAQVVSGGCDILGMKSGCTANAGATPVAYRGIENPFGNIWQFCDGINIKDGRAYVCYEPTNYASDKFTEPYEALGFVNATASGNPKVMGYDAENPLIAFTQTVGTNSYNDYYWYASGNRIVRVGGFWSYGSQVGFFCLSAGNDSSNSYASLGSRLLKSV